MLGEVLGPQTAPTIDYKCVKMMSPCEFGRQKWKIDSRQLKETAGILDDSFLFLPFFSGSLSCSSQVHFYVLQSMYKEGGCSQHCVCPLCFGHHARPARHLVASLQQSCKVLAFPLFRWGKWGSEMFRKIKCPTSQS